MSAIGFIKAVSSGRHSKRQRGKRVRLRPAPQQGSWDRSVLTSDPPNSFDPTCACIRWLNSAAWSAAPAFPLGNAPHADPEARTPVEPTGCRTAESGHARSSQAHNSSRGSQSFRRAGILGPLITFGPQTFGLIRRDGAFPGRSNICTGGLYDPPDRLNPWGMRSDTRVECGGSEPCPSILNAGVVSRSLPGRARAPRAFTCGLSG